MNLFGALLAVVAGCLAYLLWRLVDPRARLVVNERGILDRSLGLGYIRWDEIEGAYPPSSGDQESLLLMVRVSDRLARKLVLRKRKASRGLLELRCNLAGTRHSAVGLMQLIIARRAQVIEPVPETRTPAPE